jgi:hypothetical protein
VNHGRSRPQPKDARNPPDQAPGEPRRVEPSHEAGHRGGGEVGGPARRGLAKALVDGKSERHLRMMGIIHPGDLLRVFPEKA